MGWQPLSRSCPATSACARRSEPWVPSHTIAPSHGRQSHAFAQSCLIFYSARGTTPPRPSARLCLSRSQIAPHAAHHAALKKCISIAVNALKCKHTMALKLLACAGRPSFKVLARLLVLLQRPSMKLHGYSVTQGACVLRLLSAGSVVACRPARALTLTLTLRAPNMWDEDAQLYHIVGNWFAQFHFWACCSQACASGLSPHNLLWPGALPVTEAAEPCTTRYAGSIDD